MLRQPGSKYVASRSSTLLKVKTFHDAEAVVIGHQAGAGRHKGRMGALLVRLPNGTDFAIGTGFSDRERENPPTIGATVTFRYQELSDAGVPRFPSWVGLRLDASSTPAAKTSALSRSAPPALRSAFDEGAPALRSASGEGAPALRSAFDEGGSTPASSMAVPATPTSNVTSAATSGTTPRYFEFTEDTSNKFWEISQADNSLTTRWGRIGSTGQNKTKTFADEKAAANAVAKLIEQKTDEGYVERDK
jgi:DNA ligase-1